MSRTSAIAAAAAVYAAAPFDHPKAGVILRSPDGVHFRVFKLFLSPVSPFFETLFGLPQPSDRQETHNDLAVVRMAESCKTLGTLLRFCYPCTLAHDPYLEVLEDVIPVLEATEKKICHALRNARILEVESLRCFVIARRTRLERETQLTAMYTLSQPLIPVWFNLITPAADLLTLPNYHKKCGDTVYALGKDMSWAKFHYRTGRGWV